MSAGGGIRLYGVWEAFGARRPLARPCVMTALVIAALRYSTAFGQPAAPADGANQVEIEADTITYDSEANTVTASGHVEITYGERVGVAKRLVYDRRTGRVVVSGDVALADPSGTVVFAEQADLTEDFGEGAIRQLSAILTDGSHLAADRARRTGGNRTELVQASYTPCKLCEGQQPFWQIKASRIIHDQDAHTITYHHVKLQVFGVPVMYVPYFQHPDPTVKRKSGFLPPVFGHSGNLGASIETPYFWELTPYRDVTISPIFSSKEYALLKGEYRERTRTGQFSFSGSGLKEQHDFQDKEEISVSEGDFRGHIFGNGSFNLSPSSKWGFSIERTTDDTYLRRYDFSDANFLTSQLFLHTQQGRSYGAIDFYAFQGLRRFDKSGQTPLVLPYARYNFVGDPGRYGGYWSGNVNALVLQRSDGRDTRRLSTTIGYQMPYISPFGEVYRGYVQLRGDLYDVSDADLTNAALEQTTLRSVQGDNGLTGRVRPLIGLNWRLPFMRPGNVIVQQIQPIVQLIYTPRGANKDDIPNEDSQGFEFDDTNLFDVNRFPGVDRYEGGARANVGVEWWGYGPNGTSANVLIGEVFRLRDNEVFSKASGLRDRRSDYVGRIMLSPYRYLDLVHRFQLDRSDLHFKRNELWLSAGPRGAHINLAYIRLANDFTDIDPNSDHIARKELSVDGRLQIFHNWILLAGTRRDLTSQGGPLENTAGLLFQNECVELGLIFNRSFTRDRDIHPNTSVRIRFRLLNLG